MPSPACVPAPPDRASDWVDLAARPPGAAAREQAQRLMEAAPVRNRLARVLRVHTEERAWRLGAIGEEKVAAQIAKAWRKEPRWQVLHSIPVGERGSDIDHLVIGPGGVYTINAKHHPGARVWVGGNTLLVNGKRQPYLRNSRHEAKRAGDLLSGACGFPVTAQSVIVPVRAEKVTVKKAPPDVHVVARFDFARWLLRRPHVLDPRTQDILYAAARRSTTWRT